MLFDNLILAKNIYRKEGDLLEKQFKAVIQKVEQKGKHGPFAIAIIKGFNGSVTFSLEADVWQEEETPESGEIVILSNVKKKYAGWRAKQARYYIPSDEQKQ